MLGGVIGVFFDREAGGDYNNAFLDAVWNQGGLSADPVKIPVASFLYGVDMTHYWNYDGSLTTPPCTEGIKWTIIKDVQPISSTQLEWFTALWAGDTQFAGGLGNFRAV
jgi:carbonic anhydrase